MLKVLSIEQYVQSRCFLSLEMSLNAFPIGFIRRCQFERIVFCSNEKSILAVINIIGLKWVRNDC